MARQVQVGRSGRVVPIKSSAVPTITTEAVNPLASELEETKKRVASLQSEAALVEVKIAAMAKAHDIALQGAEKAKADVAKAKDEVKKLKAENKSLAAELKKAKEDIETLKSVIDKLSSQVQAASEPAEEDDVVESTDDGKKKSTKKSSKKK